MQSFDLEEPLHVVFRKHLFFDGLSYIRINQEFGGESGLDLGFPLKIILTKMCFYYIS